MKFKLLSILVFLFLLGCTSKNQQENSNILLKSTGSLKMLDVEKYYAPLSVNDICDVLNASIDLGLKVFSDSISYRIDSLFWEGPEDNTLYSDLLFEHHIKGQDLVFDSIKVVGFIADHKTLKGERVFDFLSVTNRCHIVDTTCHVNISLAPPMVDRSQMIICVPYHVSFKHNDDFSVESVYFYFGLTSDKSSWYLMFARKMNFNPS